MGDKNGQLYTKVYVKVYDKHPIMLINMAATVPLCCKPTVRLYEMCL